MSELDRLLGIVSQTSASPSGLGFNDLPTSSKGAGWGSGVAGFEEGLGHIGQALFNMDNEDFIKRKQAEADFYSRNAPGATSFTGPGGVMDGGKVSDWLAFNLAQSAPSMIPMIGASALTGGSVGLGLAGRGLATSAARTFGKDAIASGAERALAGQAEGAITGAMERQALEAAAKQVGTRYAATVGAAVGEVPVALGDILSNQYDTGKGYNVPAALAGMVPYIATDVLTGGEGALLRGATGGLERAAKTGLTSTIADYGKRVGKTALAEGAGEVGQDVINQTFGKMAVDPSIGLSSMATPEFLKQEAETFITAGAMGTVMGAPAHLLAKPALANTEAVASRVDGLKSSLEDIIKGNQTVTEIQDAQNAETDRVTKEADTARQQATDAFEKARPDALPLLPYDAAVGSAVAPVVNPLGTTPVIFSNGDMALTPDQELTTRYAPQPAGFTLDGGDGTAPVVSAGEDPIQAVLNRAQLNLFGPSGKPSPFARVAPEPTKKAPTFATMQDAFMNVLPTLLKQAVENGHMTEVQAAWHADDFAQAQNKKQFEAAKAKFEENINGSVTPTLPANPTPVDAGVPDGGAGVGPGGGVSLQPGVAESPAVAGVLVPGTGDTVAGNGDALGFQVTPDTRNPTQELIDTLEMNFNVDMAPEAKDLLARRLDGAKTEKARTAIASKFMAQYVRNQEKVSEKTSQTSNADEGQNAVPPEGKSQEALLIPEITGDLEAARSAEQAVAAAQKKFDKLSSTLPTGAPKLVAAGEALTVAKDTAIQANAQANSHFIPANQEQTREPKTEKAVSQEPGQSQTESTAADVADPGSPAYWQDKLGYRKTTTENISATKESQTAAVPAETTEVLSSITTVLNAHLPKDRIAVQEALNHLAQVESDKATTFGASKDLKAIPSVAKAFLTDQEDLAVAAKDGLLPRMIARARENAVKTQNYVSGVAKEQQAATTHENSVIDKLAAATDEGVTLDGEEPVKPINFADYGPEHEAELTALQSHVTAREVMDAKENTKASSDALFKARDVLNQALMAAKRDTNKFATVTHTENPTPMSKEAVQTTVDNYRAGWKTLPATTVVSTADMTPEQQALFKDRKGRYYTGADGKPHIDIVAESHSTPSDVVATIYHEGLGHFGLQKKFDTKKIAVMNAIYNTNDSVRKLATTELATNPKDHTGSERFASATEEVLAQMSEKGTLPQSALNRLIAFVRGFARDMGMQVKFSDNDVQAVLWQAHAAARSEKLSTVAATGEKFNTATDAFKKWFGDSKVVDMQGSPLVVYHGSSEDIAAFDPSKSPIGNQGLYFTPNIGLADTYARAPYFAAADARAGDYAKGGAIYPVYVAIKNPLILDGTHFDEKSLKGRIAQLLFPKRTGALIAQTKLKDSLADNSGRIFTARDVQLLEQAGYDGVLTTQAYPNASLQVIVAFHPEQIKSATGNNGNYDATNPDIKYSTVKAAPASIPEHLVDMATHYGGKTGLQAATDATNLASRAIDLFTSLPDIVRRYSTKMPAIKEWHDAMLVKEERKNSIKQMVDAVAAQVSKLSAKEYETVNAFVYDSTFQQKWGYDPAFDRTTTIDPEFKTRFDALDPKVQQVVKDMFTHGEFVRKTQRAAMDALKLSDAFMTKTQLEGPYAPLRRFGDYAVVLKSDTVLAAEDAAKDTPANSTENKLLDEIKRDPTNYAYSRFDTAGQAAVFLKTQLADGDFNAKASHTFKYNHGLDTQTTMPADVLRRVLAALHADESVTDDVRNVMTDNIKAMYSRTVEDRLARQAQQQRKYRAGADTNMIRGFMAQGEADANFLSLLEHGGKVNDAIYQVQREGDAGTRENKKIADLVIAHHIEASKPKMSPIQDRMVALTSAMQLSTSPAYHLSNMMQVVQNTLPQLAAKFNDYPGAWRHIMDSYKLYHAITSGNIITGKTLDLSKVKDTGLRSILQHAIDRQLLDVGMEGDLTQFNRFQTGYAVVDGTSDWASKALYKLRQVSRGVELMNRVATAASAYNMYMEKNGSEADAMTHAQDFAIESLETTQGDMSNLAAPLIIKKLPKVMVQYRKFQLMMAALYVDGFNKAFHGETPEVRAIGRRFLAYKMFHTGMAAGVLGLPLINMVGPMFAFMLGGDDEPKDPERMMRDWIGNQTLADLVLHGPLAMMGLDTSSKLGDDNIFSILPYTTVDVTSKKGLALTAASLAGGPAFGQGSRMADGLGLMKEGEYYKGMEKFMPRGVENTMQGFRMANEGYTLKSGDVMVRPEDISGVALALQTLGLPPTEIKRYQWFQSQQIEIKQFYADHERQLKKSYLDAKMSGDSEAQQTAKDDWRQLQAGKVKARMYFNNAPAELKARDVSALTSYPEYQTKREQKLQKSVPLAID